MPKYNCRVVRTNVETFEQYVEVEAEDEGDAMEKATDLTVEDAWESVDGMDERGPDSDECEEAELVE